MCEQLASIRAALTAFAGRLDLASLSAGEAAELVREAAAVEGCAAAVKALAATVAADGGALTAAGERSAADGLARLVGVAPRAARDLLFSARRLAEQPTVSVAARAGRLSREQLAVVSDAAAVDPGAAGVMLDEAVEGSLASLRDLAQRVKAAARDPEAQRRAIHAKRALRAWVDTDGVWHLSANGNPEDGAQVMAALEPFRERRFVAARRAGEREPSEAYVFDALLDLARGAAAAQGSPPAPAAPAGEGEASGRRRSRGGAAVKLLVRIDLDAWLRGFPADGETCELAGYGPIAVSAVRDLVATGDPFVAAILARGEQLVGVAHLGRQPRALQLSALQWLYPSCAVKGCAAVAHLENDHREDWAATHFTALDLLDRLCRHHHALKTRANWALVDGVGKRDFVAPSDPLHPRHAGGGTGRRAPPTTAA